MDVEKLKQLPAELRQKMTVSFCYSAPYREANANFGYAEDYTLEAGGAVVFHNAILESGERAYGIQLTSRWSHHDYWMIGGCYYWSLRPLSATEKTLLTEANEHAHAE